MDGTIGEIRMFGGNFAPRAWALCYGQLLPISQNQALFSILGTTYGGDGRTTFGLPDMRGRSAMGAGNGPGLTPRQIGQKMGNEYNNLTINQMPAHNHTATGDLRVKSGDGLKRTAPGNVLSGDASTSIYSDQAPDGTLAPNSVEVNVGTAGASQPVYHLQPNAVVNYIICLQGIFPSRS